MRSDCAGTATLKVLTGTPDLVLGFQTVIVDDGTEVLFIEVDPSTIYTGTLKKM